MNRRTFLFASAAALASLQPAFAAAQFQPKRFSVVVRGSGPDVILIPGLTASRQVWNATVAAVPGYRYHLVQVAGFGGSPAGANAQGEVVAPVAEEISRYIAANGLVRPTLVGHSMGGTIALMLAARHPAQVGKVMVVDMLPQPAGLVGSSAAGVSGLVTALGDFASSPTGRQIAGSIIGMFGNPRSDGRSDPDVAIRAARELALTDLTPELPRITAPLEVVYAMPAADSGVDPNEISRSFREGYRAARQARLVPVYNSGHFVMNDQPRAFESALRRFLASPLPRA